MNVAKRLKMARPIELFGVWYIPSGSQKVFKLKKYKENKNCEDNRKSNNFFLKNNLLSNIVDVNYRHQHKRKRHVFILYIQINCIARI